MVTVLKNNLFSIIFGVIAILAVCTLFWPIPQKFKILSASLNTRSGTAGKLDSAAKQTHMMPILSPDQSSQATLEVFPADKVTEAAKTATDQLGVQATNMQTSAVNANKHTLMLAGSLPAADDTMKYKFVQAYAAEVLNLARWQKILNSGSRPTQAAIDLRSQQLHDKIIATRVFYITSGGNTVPDPGSLQQAEAEYQAKVAGLRAQIALENAKNCEIYLDLTTNPPPLPSIQGMNVQTLPDAGTMWDAQLAMWVCDDICMQIAKINHAYADSDVPGGPPVFDVLHTPIKQLVRMDRPGAIISNAGDKGSGVGSATPRVYPLALTGRVSNALYDVLRFKLALVVDAAKLPEILHGLEAGQFFSINNVQINGVVDPAQQAMIGYRFGSKSCVNVELDVETVLMTDWTKDFLPDSRKASIAPQSGGGWSGGSGQPDQSQDQNQDNPDQPPQ